VGHSAALSVARLWRSVQGRDDWQCSGGQRPLSGRDTVLAFAWKN
jgi:hypothetical protein